MDADQLDLKITGHVVTPRRVLEDGWIGVRGEIVAGLGPADSAAPAARQVIDARASGSCPGRAEAARGLWDQVASGVVDMITSDHSPWDIAKKSRPDDIFANASEIPGVQTLLPLAYAGVVAGHGLPVLRLAELVTANPVRVFGLAPRKGQLTAGADADLVVLDPAGTTRLHPGAMQSSATWSPYHGMELSREEPVPADPAVGSVLAEAADRTRRLCLRLSSHVGHDANQMAKIAPVGMLFAPSRDGRSHCPEEWTEPDDIAVCLAALTAAVIRLDEELAP